MSFQSSNDQTNRPRISRQTVRQEWIPRGGSTSTTVVNQQSRVNPTTNEDSADSSNRTHLPQPNSKHRGNFSSRGYTAQPFNQRRGRERNGQKSKNQEGNASKESILPQLVQEIQEKLTKGNVECLICYDMVRRSAPIWSCSSCYSIFHLTCIKKWAHAPTSVDLSVEKNVGFNWRCPGCQSVQLTPLKQIRYVCFCGRRPDPPSDLYLTPHSCGEPCGKPLEKEVLGSGFSKDDLCPHVCVLQCHPGPCPPCKAFAPPQLCSCGKKIITTRCSEKKYDLTCDQRCDKLLDCWRHRCEQTCHVGSCDPCQVLTNASCFCKKKVEVILCGDMVVKGEVRAEDGVFSCDSTCEKALDCGNHVCKEICHPGPCGECNLLPNKIKTCCCGKTSLQEVRKSCLDPIPTCEKICDKLLFCKTHRCKEPCHNGDCAPCAVLVSQKCRCGSTCRTVECYKTTVDTFLCERPCGLKKNCGRHRCNDRCCALSTTSSNTYSDGPDPHFCSMTCGKKLRCGQHSCESLCHSGHCPPCIETIFNDLTCACGNTSIPPPQPCGTTPPSCQLPCLVPRPCGHPSSHSCHFGDCPPCPVPVAKECVGGHVVLRNIPCGSKDIRCNKLCGKTRQCGMHSCGRICHPAACDSSSSSSVVTDFATKASCGQVCGAPRRDCRHTCAVPCHPSAHCPDLRCNFVVTINCSCGRKSANVPCDAGGNTNGGFNGDTIYEASLLQKLPGPLQPVMDANDKKIPLGQRKLTCDEECAKLERKRVLADAFDVNHPDLDSLHFGENSSIPETLLDLYRHDPKWVISIEERCKFLVLSKNKGATTSSSLKVHIFSPMPKEKRDAVRIIAERWKLAINASGWEPKRFIIVHVTPKSKAPARVFGNKGSGSTTTNLTHQPVFDSLIDMDPRLVVSLLDLPSDADISALVLRFGGECQLVWLNDKNALAVFSDPARAATAMRRLDNGSVYHGAVVVLQNSNASSSSSSWKKAVVSESSSWGGEEWSSGGNTSLLNAWKKDKEDLPVSAVKNRWNILDPDRNMPSQVDAGVGKSATLESSVSGEVDDWEKLDDDE